VAAKGLYAFSEKIILVFLIMFVSCSNKEEDVTKGSETLLPIGDKEINSEISVLSDDIFFQGELENIGELSFPKNRLDMTCRVITKNGKLFLSNDNIVYTYSPELHRFTGIYKVDGLEDILKDRIVMVYYYIVDNIFIRYIEGKKPIPNANVAIYRNKQGLYLSVRKEMFSKKYKIIQSSDLVNWIPVGIEQRAPIILFEKGGCVFALTGSAYEEDVNSDHINFQTSEILDISDINNITLYQKLDSLVLNPGNGIFYGHMTEDREIKGVYQLDDHLFIRTLRSFEDGWSNCEITININDFSFNSKSNKIPDAEDGMFFEQLVKVNDEWRLYVFKKNETCIIDPFISDGDNIVEISEPVKEIWE
jgi:hypothetical protein